MNHKLLSLSFGESYSVAGLRSTHEKMRKHLQEYKNHQYSTRNDYSKTIPLSKALSWLSACRTRPEKQSSMKVIPWRTQCPTFPLCYSQTLNSHASALKQGIKLAEPAKQPTAAAAGAVNLQKVFITLLSFLLHLLILVVGVNINVLLTRQLAPSHTCSSSTEVKNMYILLPAASSLLCRSISPCVRFSASWSGGLGGSGALVEICCSFFSSFCVFELF